MVFGTFDGLHRGHINFLKQAKKHGDYLIAVVARDQTVKRLKKRLPVFKEKKRVKMVRDCGLVDKAILGGRSNPYDIIRRIRPDVICLGYDQKFFVADLTKELKGMGLAVKISRLKPYRPKIFHTSKLRKNSV